MTFSDSDFGTLALLAVAGMCLGVPDPLARRRVLAGGLLTGLALASLEISGPSGVGSRPADVTAFAITIGILLFGLGAAMGQVARALRDGNWRGLPRVATLGLTVTLLPLGAWLIASLTRTGGWGTALGTVAALAVLLRLITSPPATHFAQVVVRKGGRLFTRRMQEVPVAWDRGASIRLGVHAAAALAALILPQLHLFLTAVVISYGAGILLERRIGRLRGWPVSVVLALPAIVGAWYLLAHVAAGEGLRLTQLPDAPYSPAFELLVAFILGVLGWSLLSLWPFHGVSRGPLTPLLAAVLFLRLVTPALPEGLIHWQPVLYLLAGLAAWHAAAVQRGEEAVTALGALGLMSAEPTAGLAGAVLTAGAAVLRLFRLLAEAGRAPNAAGRLLLGGLPLAGALLVVPVLTGALGAQVFYTVMAVAGLVTVLWLPSR